MNITVDLKELEDYQQKMEKWARDRAVAIAGVVPIRHDMETGAHGRAAIEIAKAFDNAVKTTPMPLLIPRA